MINIDEKLIDGTRLFGWKSEPPLTPVAPDYAHYILEKNIFSEEECNEWNEYLMEQESILFDKFRTSNYGVQNRERGTTITSRHRDFNLLKLDFHGISKLKKALFEGIQTLLGVSGNTHWQETLYVNSWFNVLRQGDGMDIHLHGYNKNTFYGFHVTINATQPSFTSYYHPVKFQEDAVHNPNKIGNMTIFPNFIPHEVSLNKYETPRITIAGDIMPSTWKDEVDGFDEFKKHLVELGTVGSSE